MTDLYKLSATDLAQAIRNRRVRAVDAVSACFERIEQDNDRLTGKIEFPPSLAQLRIRNYAK